MFPTSAAAAAVTASLSQQNNQAVSNSAISQMQVVTFGGNQSDSQKELKNEIFQRQAQMAMANDGDKFGGCAVAVHVWLLSKPLIKT